MGIILMRMQAQFMVGANSQEDGGAGLLFAQSNAINIGTVGQRQRYVIFASELVGPTIASEQLRTLDQKIDVEKQRSTTPPFELTESQVQIQEILHTLYPADSVDFEDDAEEAQALLSRIDLLTDPQRTMLTEELDWFGELALYPSDSTNIQARENLLKPANRVTNTLSVAIYGGGLAGFLGFLGLILVLVLGLTGRLRSHFGTIHGHHGLYAETFALWLIVFYLVQIPAGILGGQFPEFALGFIVIAFFASLLCLSWPVFRGVRWKQVRQDIGLTLGSSPPLEPLFGITGYMMALPLLGIGVICTFVLMLIQQAGMSGTESVFTPSGGPAHPIVLMVAEGDWLARFQILLLASVAAPIVEETMFRGVLYRHLRQMSGKLGMVLSVLVAGTINAFIFAAIHPQGWVAIPALMSLAYAFVLLREWRGTLIPSILVHGLSNGLVMTLLMTVLSQQG
ncbi:MAG: type II CAAX endopeptidase family protein [Planctomycetota bacterium]|nr:type II CAAX endopeptidase family protein [Planctomycetota bacterium]